MSATIDAAIISGCFGLIGVGGTVWVAVTGFRANRRISADAFSAERARELRQEQRAAYVEIIEIVNQRRARRSAILGRARSKGLELNDSTELMTTVVGDFNDPATLGARSRLLAFASPEVRTAYDQMIVDDAALMGRIATWGLIRAIQRLRQSDMKEQKQLAELPTPEESWALVEETLTLARKRDNELIEMIRQELGSDP